MAARQDSKRRHKTITIDQKIEILDKIGKKSYTLLCEEYGIGRSTIIDIKKRESELRNYKRKMVEMGAGFDSKMKLVFTTYPYYVIYESWQLEKDLAHLDKVV